MLILKNDSSENELDMMKKVREYLQRKDLGLLVIGGPAFYNFLVMGKRLVVHVKRQNYYFLGSVIERALKAENMRLAVYEGVTVADSEM